MIRSSILLLCLLLPVTGSALPANGGPPRGAGTVVLALDESSFLELRWTEIEHRLCGTEASALLDLTWLARQLSPGAGGGDPNPFPPLTPELASIIVRPKLINPDLYLPPPLGAGVVAELDAAWWSEHGERGEIRVIPRRFCARGAHGVAVSCAGWTMAVVLDARHLAASTLELRRVHEGGGSFNGRLELPLLLHFENRELSEVVELEHRITLRLEGPWASTAGSGAYINTGPFEIDGDCDGRPEITVAPTSDLHLGWTQPPEGAPSAAVFCGAGEGGTGWLCLRPYPKVP